MRVRVGLVLDEVLARAIHGHRRQARPAHSSGRLLLPVPRAVGALALAARNALQAAAQLRLLCNDRRVALVALARGTIRADVEAVHLGNHGTLCREVAGAPRHLRHDSLDVLHQPPLSPAVGLRIGEGHSRFRHDELRVRRHGGTRGANAGWMRPHQLAVGMWAGLLESAGHY